MVICDIIALSLILKGVHRGQFCNINVNFLSKYALEACTYILIPEMLTVAAVLETHDNAMTSQFPIKLCENKHGGAWEI